MFRDSSNPVELGRALGRLVRIYISCNELVEGSPCWKRALRSHVPAETLAHSPWRSTISRTGRLRPESSSEHAPSRKSRSSYRVRSTRSTA